MDYDVARDWLERIAIGAAVLWAIGAWFVARSGTVLHAPATGDIEINGTPPDLVERARRALLHGIANSPLSRIKLRETSKDSLVWEGGVGVRHTASLRVGGAGGGRARIVWQLEATSGLLTAARWVTAIGALTIGGLYCLLSEFVVASDNPGVRGQVFQMAQAAHVLWPPFLLAGLARGLKRRLVTDLDRTLTNLQLEADRPAQA